jgi:hypothetical protein
VTVGKRPSSARVGQRVKNAGGVAQGTAWGRDAESGAGTFDDVADVDEACVSRDVTGAVTRKTAGYRSNPGGYQSILTGYLLTSGGCRSVVGDFRGRFGGDGTILYAEGENLDGCQSKTAGLAFVTAVKASVAAGKQKTTGGNPASAAEFTSKTGGDASVSGHSSRIAGGNEEVDAGESRVSAGVPAKDSGKQDVPREEGGEAFVVPNVNAVKRSVVPLDRPRISS